MTEVVLYGRPGCHLCEQARAEILAFDGVALHEVDIEADDRLLAEMLERIPVVEIGGVTVSELEFDRDAFSAALRGLAEPRRC